MSSQNVVHHKPAPPAVSPVIVLDDLVKKAVRKEWLELDYGANWWSNDHAPTIYANSKLIPPLNTFISNRWSELKPILLKRPVAARKIRLRKVTDETNENENSLQTPVEQDNGQISLENEQATSDACNQSSDRSETIDLFSLLLNSPPEVKAAKLPSRSADDRTASQSILNNLLASMPSLNDTSSHTVAANIRTEETSASPSTYPSTSSNLLQSFTYNVEYNTPNLMVDIDQSYPKVKQIQDKDNSLKMKIKLGDCSSKKDKEASSGSKEVKSRDSNKPKKARTAKPDTPRKRKRTVKAMYPKSFCLKKCYTKMVRISDEVLKKYTGLTNEDLRSYYSKNKLVKCSNSSNNKGKVSLKNGHQSSSSNKFTKNGCKIFPPNVCGSPPGPLSKKPWNLPNAKNKKPQNVTSNCSQSSSNAILNDTSITPIDKAHSSLSPVFKSSDSCSLSIITCTESQNLSPSKPLSPVKSSSLSLTEKLELLKGESLSITTTSSSGPPSVPTNEKINGEITEPSPSVTELLSAVAETEKITLIKENPEPAGIAIAPVQELPEAATTVTAPVGELPEPENTVIAPVEKVPEPAKTVDASIENVPEPGKTVDSPMKEIPEPAKTVDSPMKEIPEPAKTVDSPMKESPEPAKTVDSPMKGSPEPAKTVDSPLKEISEPANTVDTPAKEITVPVNAEPESSPNAVTAPSEPKQTKVISESINFPSETDNGDVPLKINVKEEPNTDFTDAPLQIADVADNLNSNGLTNNPNASNESENLISNVDNKKLENRTKPLNGGKTNELLAKMLGSPLSSKSRPISDYVNGKIIPLGQKHSGPGLAVIIKRKSVDDFPVISGSLSLVSVESNKDSKKLKEDTDNSIIKEIASPDHTTDVNMNYQSKILLNGFTTKNPTLVQKGKHRDVSPVTNDKPDSTESNKENTSYVRNKLEDASPPPPAKKLKSDERSDENINKSNLKIDLSKMELEPEDVLDKTRTTDVTSSKNVIPKPVLDLPLTIFQDYECITCVNKFLHFNDWRLHFNDYPQCANAQDSS